MDDMNELLAATTARLYGDLFPSDRIPEADRWEPAAWQAVAELGLPLALLDEEQGGVGLDPATALGLLRIAGRATGALPLGETMLANRVLAQAGLPPADGPASVAAAAGDALAHFRVFGDGACRIAGTVAGVPWARVAEAIALTVTREGETWILRLPPTAWTVTEGRNMAGLPRDTLAIDTTISPGAARPAPQSWNENRLRAAGAAIRVQEMAGALDSVLDLTVRYAGERIQFGKPIGKQQAVQQQLAVLAGQSVAAGAAASIAADAFGEPDGMVAIAAAKVRAGEAAGLGASIAHQIHGAIGFTSEHPLHLFTRRLWAWRDEFGSERVWSTLLGRLALQTGADDFWPLVTAIGQRRPAEAI